MCWRGGRKRVRAREASTGLGWPREGLRPGERAPYSVSEQASDPGGRTTFHLVAPHRRRRRVAFRIPDIFLLAIKTHCMMVRLDEENEL